MKTAMQELIDELKLIEAYPMSPLVLRMATDLLEKEKEQIVDFGYKCRESKNTLPQDIFNQTYNQNK